MNESPKYQMSRLAKVVAGAFLLGSGLTAQAGLIGAGNTQPALDNPNVGGVQGADGTIFFAVFENEGVNFGTDPWGTGGLDLVARHMAGFQAPTLIHPANPGLDTSAKYLYVYQVYNNEPLGMADTLTLSGISVNPNNVTSWGAFQRLPGKSGTGGPLDEEGTYLNFAPDSSGCGYGAAGNIAPPMLCDVSKMSVTIDVDANWGKAIGGTPTGTPYTLNGLNTYSPVHTLRLLGGTINTAAVELTNFNVAAQFRPVCVSGTGVPPIPCIADGNGPLFGGPTPPVGAPPTVLPDGYQFSTVFYLTSNTPMELQNATIADGTVSNGTVLAPRIVPEPMVLALLGGGLLLLGWSRRLGKS